MAKIKEQHAAARVRMEAAQTAARRYLIMDTTVEKLGILQALPVNRSGCLVVRDEFAGLLATTKRAGHENDRAFFLEEYNVTRPYTTDRATRDSVAIPVLTLSMLGGIQPTQVEPLIRAARQQQVDEGLLERFQANHLGRPGLTRLSCRATPT